MAAELSEVETLREAARGMRERAQAATDGRWYATEYLPDGFGGALADVRSNHPEYGDDAITSAHEEPCCIPADAEHIAGMDPLVALAVADWLDDVADQVARMVDLLQTAPDVDEPGGLHYGDEDAARLAANGHAAFRQGLAVARTYLRTTP